MSEKHLFFKDGKYEAVGGFFIRNGLKEFFGKLKEQGLNPCGVIVDDESFNLEVLVEINEAYINSEYNKGQAVDTYDHQSAILPITQAEN